VLFHASLSPRPAVVAAGVCVVLLASGLRVTAADQSHAAGPAAAGAVAPPVEELVAKALAGAPSLAARRARLEAARLAVQAAEVPPDPTVEFEYRDGGFPKWTVGSDPMSMIGASVRQPLLTKGRKAARHAAALAEVDVRSAQAGQSAADLATAVRTAYANLYAIDRERAILDDSREIAHLLAETAMARYASGGTDQATVLRAQVEQTRVSQRAVDLEAERTAVVVSINRLVNQAPDTPLGEVRSLPEPPPPAGSLARLPDMAARNAPEVSVRQADVAAAARRVEMARSELHPNYTVGGSLYWQGGVDRLASVTFGIEWPARKNRKQLPLLASSERDLEAARHDLDDASAGMRAEAARLVADIERDETQIAEYRSALLPQSAAAFDAVRSSYLTGSGDFSSVLDEFRRWTDARVQLASLEAGRFALRSQLDALVNPAGRGDPSPVASQDSPSSKEPR
jgi:cobalt-zinc-cadmium efflux system outer membrane protein